jgi:hypothetical protein
MCVQLGRHGLWSFYQCILLGEINRAPRGEDLFVFEVWRALLVLSFRCINSGKQYIERLIKQLPSIQEAITSACSLPARAVALARADG